MITTLGAGDRDGMMVVVGTIQGDGGHIIQVPSSSQQFSEHIFVNKDFLLITIKTLAINRRYHDGTTRCVRCVTLAVTRPPLRWTGDRKRGFTANMSLLYI